MTALRQRMREDMQLRGLAPRTQEAYLAAVRQLAVHYRRSLDQLSDDELRFLTQIRRYSGNLNDSDRKLVVAMVKKMAAK